MLDWCLSQRPNVSGKAGALGKTQNPMLQCKEGACHTRFMMHLYRKQIREGRLFLHEQPLRAQARGLIEVRQLMAEEGAMPCTASQEKGSLPIEMNETTRNEQLGIPQELAKASRENAREQSGLKRSAEGREIGYTDAVYTVICNRLSWEERCQSQNVRRLLSMKANDKSRGQGSPRGLELGRSMG